MLLIFFSSIIILMEGSSLKMTVAFPTTTLSSSCQRLSLITTTTKTTRRRQRRCFVSQPFFMSKKEQPDIEKDSSMTSNSVVRTIVPGSSYCSEYEIKKSRFIAYAQHANSWFEAQEYIQMIQKEHPKARHVCYGYCGSSSSQSPSSSSSSSATTTTTTSTTERCSDDGEPTGTAGLPILGAIQGEGLANTVCVVVRYFGGIKLGAGGLIRAYGTAARQTLRTAHIEIQKPQITLRVQVDAQYVGAIYDIATKCKGTTANDEYGIDGSLSIDVTCDKDHEHKLRQELQDSTRGTVKLSTTS